MSPSLPRKLLFLIASFIAVLACSLAGTPGSQAPSTTATSALAGAVPISATPIRLLIPSGLATGATAETIDVVTDQTGAGWDVAPAHLQLTLQGYSVEISAHVPQVFVYPAQQYAGLNPAAAESLKRLQAVLADPAAHYDQNTLPRVPFLNAAQVLAAQQKVIHFSGGAGVRFITHYMQGISPINNSGLFYHFEGLSDDGKYYIVAVLPVNLPFLAADNNPDSLVSSTGIPFPAPSASPSDYDHYYHGLADRIAAAPIGQYGPPLALLDELIQSIVVSH